MQAFDLVTSSVDGHGVVTQRTPVSLVAHTGLYSLVHIADLGSLHCVAPVEFAITAGVDGFESLFVCLGD